LSLDTDFQFLDTGPLVDGELELLTPQMNRIDGYLAACRHPLTRQHDPQMAKETRQRLVDLLDYAPEGRFIGKSPGYHFWMNVAGASPDTRIAGSITLRIGSSRDIELYVGHIGYQVFPAMRGHHYAERASRLLFSLAKRHGLGPLWITCNPDNFASRRTCERLGGTLIDIVPVPADHELYARGDRQKCRYRVAI
jgi:tagatose 1,6-diphosphate aldolase